MIILESGIGNYVISNGKKYSYFGGNNYLGMSNAKAVKDASIRAIRKYGVNFSASRRTTGTAAIHLELERELSIFKEKEDSVIFASGYQGNSILLDVLKDQYSEIFIDQFAHPSIVSGIPSNKRIKYYNHLDSNHLRQLVSGKEGAQSIIVTDGVFALTGEIAPLDKIYEVAKLNNAILIVDDAHATGILGKTGKGTPEYFNIHHEANVFQSETMSKALGSYGGFISGTTDFISAIRENSTTYQASTSLAPPVVAAGIASLKILRENQDLGSELLKKSGLIRKEIKALGFVTSNFNTPIIPLIMRSLDEAKELSFFFEEKGIIVPYINYPVNKELKMLRIAVTTGHTSKQVEQLLDNLLKWKRKNGKN